MKEELEKYLNSLVEKNVFPGCNYGIITPKEELSGTIGYKSIIPTKEIDSINNASITNLLVTNTLISFAIRDGKLGLEDSVKKYIEFFPYGDVQILHLLTHSAGLKSAFDKYPLTSKDEFIHSIDRMFQPGTNVKYMDVNFILLGFILEKVYGGTLDALAIALIFKPLEMEDTMYRCVSTELTKERIPDENADFLKEIVGYASVLSTISDCSHFLSMVLHDGFYCGKKFLDKKYIDLWFTPLFINEEGLRSTVGWFYGKSVNFFKDMCGEETIFYENSLGNFVFIDRSNDVAVILLSEDVKLSEDIKREIVKEIYQLLEKYHKI